LLAGLAALKEVAELGFLSGGSSSPVTLNGLFFSNLESVHTFSDRIVRRSRNVLTRVMNEAVEFELLEGEVGAKPLAAESGRVGENKGSKDKKKRRKRSSVQKIAQEGKDLADLTDLVSKPLEVETSLKCLHVEQSSETQYQNTIWRLALVELTLTAYADVANFRHWLII
jgi:hypothetical protein